jgi:predicted nucleic acid-binding protein
MDELVVDASALVDLLLANELGQAVGRHVAGHRLPAPAHVDAEALSALGRLQRAGDLDADDVETKLALLRSAPITRHATNDLLLGAWARRHRLRLADALYVELATTLGCHLVTTDRRLHDMPVADMVTA